ncbi:MAG: hypothetical protein BWK78_09760 [Thiotrichaceae bacterium IS1]|nr:MAG: hypothetical protein BWK78_09760 [Thiotrichaceae bacterium IS1]
METGKIAIKALLDAARVSLENGDYKQSVDRYTQAQTIDPNEVSFNDWNGICWIGIFNNHAAEVMKACENTLIVSNNDELFRGARGVARAMTGDKAGALEDFEAFIRLANQQLKDSPTEKDQLLLETVILQWQHWIEQLRNGENPFTRSNLAMLREGLTALDTGFGFDPYYVGQVTENHKDPYLFIKRLLRGRTVSQPKNESLGF